MAQCDRLEALLNQRETHQADLARAAIARFTADPTPANLEYLFHDSFNISPADLRKVILTLAVQGKLVKQNMQIKNEAFKFQGTEDSLPENWKVVSMEKVAEQIVDCPHSTPIWTKTGKICVRTNQIHAGFLDLSQCRFVSEDTFNGRIRRLRPQFDDILYSREGGILGIACRVPRDVEICLGQRMILIRTGRQTLPAFLELVLNSPYTRKIVDNQITGGAVPRVNVATIKSIPIPLPPLDEQKQIIDRVANTFYQIEHLEFQCDELKKIERNARGSIGCQ